MAKIGSRARLVGVVAGLGMGIVAVGPARGQGMAPLPDPLPSLPAPTLEPAAGAGPAFPSPPEVRPTPTVTEVPPGGIRPTWFREPDDPVGLARRGPKHVEHKRNSTIWRRLQARIYGYPEEFVPRPLGAAVSDHALAMTANAAAARLTLYGYDFVQGSAELSPRGQDQLAKLVPQMIASPYPLLIERTPGNPDLAAARREAVAIRLAQGPCPIPQERVLVGVPIATGLSGVNAQVIAGNALGRVQQYGPPIPLQSNGVNSPSTVTSSSGINGP